jgi:hypothetical protein
MNEKWLNATCKIPLIVSLNESDANSVEQNVVLLAEKNSVGDGGPSLICRKTMKLMERSRRTSSPLSADKKRK